MKEEILIRLGTFLETPWQMQDLRAASHVSKVALAALKTLSLALSVLTLGLSRSWGKELIRHYKIFEISDEGKQEVKRCYMHFAMSNRHFLKTVTGDTFERASLILEKIEEAKGKLMGDVAFVIKDKDLLKENLLGYASFFEKIPHALPLHHNCLKLAAVL